MSLLLLVLAIRPEPTIIQPIYIPSKNHPSIIVPSPPRDDEHIIDIIHEINNANAKIKSLYYDDLTFRIEQQNTKAKLKGFLAYEKPKNFRIIVNSFWGTESDIGSNEEIFWFWSKRMRPAALYYSSHENYRSRLKTPFHPIWLMNSLGINQIDTSDIQAYTYGSHWAVSQKCISTQGELVKKVILIDEKNKRILAHYLYDKNEKLIMATEITEFYRINDTIIPKTINTIWYEENVKIQWVLNSPRINLKIASNYWKEPSRYHRINIGY